MAGRLTEARTYFERVHSVTGERAGRIDVTGRSERDIDRIERGALRNMHPDWYLDLVVEHAGRAALKERT